MGMYKSLISTNDIQKKSPTPLMGKRLCDKGEYKTYNKGAIIWT
nr:MAG TPA: hypothetical protein [Caudoviricetes sp.]